MDIFLDMRYVVRENKALSTEETTVYGIRINELPSSPEDLQSVLEFMRTMRQEMMSCHSDANWLVHPIPAQLRNKAVAGGVYYYLEPIKKLNHIFAAHGTLSRQIEYLQFMGVTDAISRHPLLRDAVNYVNFCDELNTKAGIMNASLPFKSADIVPAIRTIHAVHPMFLDDEEIQAGLHVSYRKKTDTANVMYVCSEQTLALALKCCEPDSTLIIDGHWEHDRRSTHGVWECSTAAEIAQSLCVLLYLQPGKINNIRLWGCEAGYLADYSELPTTFSMEAIQFKDDYYPDIFEREMGMFRNRAVYYSRVGEFPFAPSSLAGQIITHINDPNITVTATSSRTYPYPIGKVAEYNIASDANQWRGQHFWSTPRDTEAPPEYDKLHRVKSITCTKMTTDLSAFPLATWYPKDQSRRLEVEVEEDELQPLARRLFEM